MSEPHPSMNQDGVLDDVRRALGRSTTQRSVRPTPLGPFIETVDRAEPRELMARFTEEALAVRAQVHYIKGNLQLAAGGGEQSTTQPADKLRFVGEIVEHIAEICADYKGQEIALSGAPLFAEMDLTSLLAAEGFSPFVSSGVDHEKLVDRLAGCAVGLTTADYAIAETGTIVVSNEEPNALLVSLLPPVHIALVGSSQIAATLDEVIKAVQNERIGRVDPSRSVTLITGPSRTSDVELVLSIGVHGPKKLHVIILD